MLSGSGSLTRPPVPHVISATNRGGAIAVHNCVMCYTLRMPLKDREARNTYAREYYKRYPEKHKVMTAKNRILHRTKITSIIQSVKSRPCVDCENSYPPYVMDLDHVRGVKSFNISRAARLGVSINTLLTEIEKCEVVCSNCHRLRTHSPSGTLIPAQ